MCLYFSMYVFRSTCVPLYLVRIFFFLISQQLHNFIREFNVYVHISVAHFVHLTFFVSNFLNQNEGRWVSFISRPLTNSLWLGQVRITSKTTAFICLTDQIRLIYAISLSPSASRMSTDWTRHQRIYLLMTVSVSRTVRREIDVLNVFHRLTR